MNERGSRLLGLATKLRKLLEGHTVPYWRRNQRSLQIVELGTGALYALQRSEMAPVHAYADDQRLFAHLKQVNNILASIDDPMQLTVLIRPTVSGLSP